MIAWLRYRFLMRRLRSEIAQIAGKEQKTRYPEKIKSAAVTACKAYGSIV